MAQVDIGKIKIVWKGPWNSGTAYTVDDAVSHSGSSYICIQAGTNQNPSTATAYWQQMAGKGTDADLINISGTAQGDIYYNNGSAIARLAPGTANQVLQTGGSGANPSWVDAAGGGVLQVKETIYHNLHGINNASMGIINSNFKVDITPTEADSKFLLHTTLSLGTNHHDTGSTVSFFDSQSWNKWGC